MDRAKATAGNGSRVNYGQLIMGGAIIAVGGLIGMVGVAVCGVAIAKGVRRWARETEVPPRELAHRKWTQARSAVDASVNAWQSKGKEAVPAGSAGRS